MKEDTAKILRNQISYKGKQYFSNYYKGWSQPWFNNLKLDRPQISTISRIRADHHSLNESLARKRIITSPLCECGQVENINHVFWICRLYATERQTLLKALAKIGITQRNITELIKQPTTKIVYILHNFLKSIKKKI